MKGKLLYLRKSDVILMKHLQFTFEHSSEKLLLSCNCFAGGLQTDIRAVYRRKITECQSITNCKKAF